MLLLLHEKIIPCVAACAFLYILLSLYTLTKFLFFHFHIHIANATLLAPPTPSFCYSWSFKTTCEQSYHHVAQLYW